MSSFAMKGILCEMPNKNGKGTTTVTVMLQLEQELEQQIWLQKQCNREENLEEKYCKIYKN